MVNLILTGSKYLIIICFAYFTYTSVRAQRDVPDERKKTSYTIQRVTMIAIHALAFLTICIQLSVREDIELKLGQALGLYFGQLAYLLVMSTAIPMFVSLSKGLNNVMCMFLTIGFIIQTRLDFHTSLRQFLIIIAGSAAFIIFVFLCKRAKFMRNLTWVYALLGMALLATVLVLARVQYGAKLAIDLGGFFSFQPAEFVKILFVLFIASAFYRANHFKTVLITGACAAVHVLILVFCRDLGSALILFMIYVMMLYVATKKIRYVAIGFSALAIGGVVGYRLFDHVKERVGAWQDPWSTIDDAGYQIAQGLFAIGTGGWFGSGLFGGKPKTVPLVSNDMVFSAISEELGGIFCILLILLCLCYILMIFRVAMRVNHPFYKLLAFGIGSAYGFQVFLTIGGTTKFIPLTGINLPFISSGGSSLLASMLMIGMVQALYVISEADVERERELVALHAPLSAFEGYEEEAEPEEAQTDRIMQVVPEEDTQPHRMRSQKERIAQMVPDEAEEKDDVQEDAFVTEEQAEEPLAALQPCKRDSQRRRIMQVEEDDF